MFDEIRNIVNRQIDEVIESHKQLMQEALENTFVKSQEDVHVKTGKLKASVKQTATKIGDDFVYEISYGDSGQVDYAVMIHERSDKPYFKFLQRAFIAETNKMKDRMGI